MTFEAYNADGEAIEGVLPPEEAKTLQETLAETKAKLEKLENKDFNFRKLEQMTEEEKAKLTATELSLKQQQEKLEADQKNFFETSITETKNDVLDGLVGDDAELRKKVELNYARLKDSESAKSRSEVKKLMEEAYVLSVGTRSTNPINAAFNRSGSAPVARSSSGKLSADAMEVGRKLGLTDADMGVK